MADGVAAFKGIPYAAPPFDPNRFQPPRPAQSWEGVREALDYGPTAPKAPYFPPFDVLLPEIANEGIANLGLLDAPPSACCGRVGASFYC